METIRRNLLRTTEARQRSEIQSAEEHHLFPSWLMHKKEFTDILYSRNKLNIDRVLQKRTKTDYDVRAISSYVRRVRFFKKMPRFQLYAVCEKMSLTRITEGTTLWK